MSDLAVRRSKLSFDAPICLIAIVLGALVAFAIPYGRVGVGLGEGTFSGVVLFGILCYFIGVIFARTRSGPTSRVWLFSVGFFVRICIALALTMVFQYDDEFGMHDWAVGITLDTFHAQVDGYVSGLAWLYSLFGPHILIPKIFNSLLGSLLPFLIHDLTFRATDNTRTSRAALHLSMFFPPLVLFSVLNLREISTAFLLTLVVWSLSNKKNSALSRGVLALSGIATLGWLRGAPWGLSALAILLIYIALPRNISWRQLIRRQIWLIPLAVPVVLLAARPAVEVVISDYLPRASQGYFTNRAFASGATVTQFLDPLQVLNPINFVVLLIRGIYSPSPLRGFFDPGIDTVMEGVNSVAWYLLMPFAIAGFLVAWRQRLVAAIGVSAAGLFAVTAAATIFGADPARHRTVLIPFLIILGSIGFAAKSAIRSRVIFLWWAGAAFFTFAFLSLRGYALL